MPPRGFADQPLTAAAAPVGANHLGRCSGLVDEHQALGIKLSLTGFPQLPRSRHVGPLLLGGVQSFF